MQNVNELQEIRFNVGRTVRSTAGRFDSGKIFSVGFIAGLASYAVQTEKGIFVCINSDIEYKEDERSAK